MIHRVLNIGNWITDFLFAEKKYDKQGVLSCLRDAGAPKSVLDRCESIMDDLQLNNGFTYSNKKRKRSVVVVGPSSSGAEFLNTFVHETRHMADVIANSLGYQLDGEFPAYVSGDAAMMLAKTICELGCR